MTFDKFTIKAQEAVQEAVNTAQQAGQQAIEPVHLLQGILVKSRDVTNFIFQKFLIEWKFNHPHSRVPISSEITTALKVYVTEKRSRGCFNSFEDDATKFFNSFCIHVW